MPRRGRKEVGCMKGKRQRLWTLVKTVTVHEEGERGENVWRCEHESREFANFAEARGAFRALVRECALGEGATFDGDGEVRRLRRYFGRVEERVGRARRDPAFAESLESRRIMGTPDAARMAGDYEAALAVPDALRAWLLDMGSYDENPMGTFKWTDWSIGIVSEPGSFALGFLNETSRIEWYDAQIFTDAFDMSDADRAYELSIRPHFDAYDNDARSLRVRLVPGKPDGRGRFPWPEDDGVAWPFPEGAAPCLGGAFDDNFSA